MIRRLCVLALGVSFSAMAATGVQSLIQNIPGEVIPNEVYSFKPVSGHHFNYKAPHKCGNIPPVSKTPTKVFLPVYPKGKTAGGGGGL